jgi:hypothetical protein
MNKVQLGISYAPQLYNYGQSIISSTAAAGGGSNGVSADQDIIKGVAQYTGNFKPVNVTASAQWIHGGRSSKDETTTSFGNGLFSEGFRGLETKDFNAWGLGTQVGFNGWTVGGGYNSLGDYNVVTGQSKDQSSWNLGAKYEFDKVGVAVNYITGRGYDNILTGGVDPKLNGNTNYVKTFQAAGAGATYTWFPGLTSNLDGVIFGQKIADAPTTDASKQGGYTVMVSQRLAF